MKNLAKRTALNGGNPDDDDAGQQFANSCVIQKDGALRSFRLYWYIIFLPLTAGAEIEQIWIYESRRIFVKFIRKWEKNVQHCMN